MRFRHLHACAFALLVTFLAGTASAQIIFTVSATAQTTEMGYTSDNSYTFTFTLNNYAPTAPVGSTSSGYRWEQSDGVAPALWSNVTGGSLAGSWVPSPGDPDNELRVRSLDGGTVSQGSIYLSGSTDSATTSGLTVNGVDFYSITAEIFVTQDHFDTAGGSLPNPATYFSAYLGSPTVFSNQMDSTLSISDNDENTVYFSVNSLTISAVPEPTTYALLAGLICLSGVIWHRRRRLHE